MYMADLSEAKGNRCESPGDLPQGETLEQARIRLDEMLADEEIKKDTQAWQV